MALSPDYDWVLSSFCGWRRDNSCQQRALSQLKNPFVCEGRGEGRSKSTYVHVGQLSNVVIQNSNSRQVDKSPMNCFFLEIILWWILQDWGDETGNTYAEKPLRIFNFEWRLSTADRHERTLIWYTNQFRFSWSWSKPIAKYGPRALTGCSLV